MLYSAFTMTSQFILESVTKLVLANEIIEGINENSQRLRAGDFRALNFRHIQVCKLQTLKKHKKHKLFVRFMDQEGKLHL